MNEQHRVLCSSDVWAGVVKDHMLPWVLEGLDPSAFGDNMIEIGPGPGMTTDIVRTLTARLTVVEIDDDLAGLLATRFAGTNVVVHHGDATRLPFADGSFTGGVCFTMLHHVPTVDLQDRLLAEMVRVVTRGGWLVGSDSVASPELEALHDDDTYNPVNPSGLAVRLATVGLTDVEVTVNEFAFRFRGTIS